MAARSNDRSDLCALSLFLGHEKDLNPAGDFWGKLGFGKT
jgi:hypothetical protein